MTEDYNAIILSWLEKVCTPFEWRMIFKMGKIDLLDPSLWTLALYAKIEKYLSLRYFVFKLAEIVCHVYTDKEEDIKYHHLIKMWMSSTPLQKATALLRVIESEVKE